MPVLDGDSDDNRVTDDTTERPAGRPRDRGVRAAASAFALTSAYASVVSVRERLAGRPLGIGMPLSVPVGLLVAWGSAIAAPWPMPVGALAAAARTDDPETSGRAALVCAGIGIAGVIGLLVEPNTYDVRAQSRANRIAIIAGFATTGLLAATGLWGWWCEVRARRG